MRNAVLCILLVAGLFMTAAAQQPNDVQFPVKFNPTLQSPVKDIAKSVRKSDKRKKDSKKSESEEDAEKRKKEEKERIKQSERPIGAPPPPGGASSEGTSGSGGGASVSPSAPSDDPTRSAGAGSTLKIEAKHAKPISKNAKVFLDYNDADLLVVIKYFSETTGRNFILQERLAKAKITIMSPNPVTVEEAWRTFLTLLAVNNISVVQEGKFLIIMNEKDTLSQGISVVKEDKLPDVFKMVATILKFKYVPAQEMDKVVKIFRDKGGESLIFDDKTMILVDYAANIRKIRELTQDLDQPTDSDTARLHFVRLVHIVPSDAKKLIDDIFKDFTKASGKQQKKAGDNTPALGGVAGEGKTQQPAPVEGQPPAEEGTPDAITSMYVQIVADDRNEQLIILSNKATYELILQVVKRIDHDIEGEGEIHVLKLQNAKAKDLVTTLNSLTKGGKQQNKGQPKGNEVFEGEVNISANEATNSLVIVSSLRDFRNLKKVVEQLDVRRKQVFVEAVIMEVKVSEDLEYGNSYASAGFEATIGGEKIPIFFAKAFSTPTPGLVAGLLGPTIAGTDQIPGLSPVAGIPSLGILLNAMKNDSNVNVMSAPHILTTDNEEAEITVGDTIPFPSGNIISGTAGSQITYKREDVALKLKIKPQINESGYMTLQIDQEVTELGANTQYGYTTSKRAAKTIINAEDQQTVVIGGLMKDIVTESENKVPILGDIPLLGALFKYTKNKKEKVNLLIILTPHIVEGKEDFERIYKRKMREREEFAKKFYGSISEHERSITLEKKRGALLSMARLLDKDRRSEQEEKERVDRMSRRRAIMIGPDGMQKDIEMGRQPDGVSGEELPAEGAPAPDAAGPTSVPAGEPEVRMDAAEDTLIGPSESVPSIEEQ